MMRYEVIARRSGDQWALQVPFVPGAHSQCERLDQAASKIIEAIAMVLDVPDDSFEVEIRTID